MKALRQMGSGFIIGVVSLLLVIGGISLSLAETSAPPLPPTPSPIPTTFVVEFASPFPIQDTPTASPTESPFPTATIAQPTSCPVPGGWTPITVGANDTLYSIAERYKITADILDAKNCLNGAAPAAGSILYVPPIPTVTIIPCGPPSTWIKAYIVKPGDNLFRISLLYRTTVAQLQSANCMGSSTNIIAGLVLWVPNVPTSTPEITITNTNTVLPTNTFTNTPDFSTPTLTFTFTSSPMPAATSTPTLTPLP